MLGRAWQEFLQRAGIGYVAPARSELDLAAPATIAKHLRSRPRLVINAAAYTQVDKAEAEPEQARLINATAVGVLAQACAEAGATLIHYSTDYVFNGQANRPYPTDHPIDPVNAYGQSKAEGEEAIRRSGCDHLLIRTSWLYAPWGTNFVRTIANLTATRDSIRVVDDQRGRPTSCESLARVSWKLQEAGARGAYHVAGGGECTWYQFACEIGRLSAARCRVEPCTTAEFPRPAKRPAYSVLDLSATQAIAGPMTSWQDDLASVMQQLSAVAA